MKAKDVLVDFDEIGGTVDGWDEGSRHFDVTVSFTAAGKTVARSFEYHMGSGLKGAPAKRDLLGSLALDAQSGHQTFADFCDEFGYDEDSRKAHATWEACRKTYEDLEAVFGTALDEFTATEWDA